MQVELNKLIEFIELQDGLIELIKLIELMAELNELNELIELIELIKYLCIRKLPGKGVCPLNRRA